MTGAFFGPDGSPLSNITFEAIRFVPADRDRRATGTGFGMLQSDATFEVDFGGENMGMPRGEYLVVLIPTETDQNTQYWQFAGQTIWRRFCQEFDEKIKVVVTAEGPNHFGFTIVDKDTIKLEGS